MWQKADTPGNTLKPLYFVNAGLAAGFLACSNRIIKNKTANEKLIKGKRALQRR